MLKNGEKYKNFYFFELIIFELNSQVINNISSSWDRNSFKDEKVKKNLRKLHSRKKNLVIGTIVGYTWERVRNYFISLIIAKSDNCDIVMFVGNMAQDTIDKIKSCGVIIYEIPAKYNNGRVAVNNYRFKLYVDFLENNIDKYNMILHTDIRDTIFQKDIFQFYEDYNKPFLGIFLEDNIISGESLNIAWTNFYCGDLNIKHNQIVCICTLLGTVDKFIEFSKVLWQMVEEKNDINIAREQGAANCLIYGKQILKDYIIAKDNHGPVMTICLTKRELINLDNNDNILNFDGQIAAVIHQYDRKVDIP